MDWMTWLVISHRWKTMYTTYYCIACYLLCVVFIQTVTLIWLYCNIGHIDWWLHNFHIPLHKLYNVMHWLTILCTSCIWAYDYNYVTVKFCFCSPVKITKLHAHAFIWDMMKQCTYSSNNYRFYYCFRYTHL